MLVPLCAVLTVAGSAIGVALFGYGNADVADAAPARRRAGRSPRSGCCPYALVMLQLRVFYAMKDARTPTLIMVVMTVVKIPLLYLCADQLPPEHVVIGVLLVNSLTFVVGAVLGQMWLWVRLGRLQSMRVVKVIAQSDRSPGSPAWRVGVRRWRCSSDLVLRTGRGRRSSRGSTWSCRALVTRVVAFGLLAAFRVPELSPRVATNHPTGASWVGTNDGEEPARLT